VARPNYMTDCTTACEVWPVCTVCGHTKSPAGRSLPLDMCSGYCDPDCPGYRTDPQPGHLFPGELAQYDNEADRG